MRNTFGFPSYFDGDSVRPGVSFEWEGTPHESRSAAYLSQSDGWITSHGSGATISQVAPLDQTRPLSRGRIASAFAYAGTLYENPNTPEEIPYIEIAPFGITGGPLDRTADNAALVEPNVEYSGSIAVSTGKARTDQSFTLWAFIVWFDATGTLISRSEGEALTGAWGGSDNLGGYSTWRTRTVTGISPPNAAFATVGVHFETPGGPVDHDATLLVDTAMLVIGPDLPDYFDGSTASDSIFIYEWDGEADRSESRRIGEVPSSPPSDIVDPNCPPPPAAPRPPSIAPQCDSSVEEWRRVWYVVPPESVYEWGAVIPTFTINSGADPVDDIRISIWANPDDTAPADFDDSREVAGRWLVGYLPANSTMVLDGVTRSVTAQQPGGGTQEAGYLVSGVGGAPVRWPELVCGQGYLIAIDTPLGDDPENISLTLDLTRRFG